MWWGCSVSKKYYTVREAAEAVGVTPPTVRQWIRRGHVKAVEKEYTVVKTVIPEEELTNVFDVTCQWCGKVFQSVHPLQAKFCCYEHGQKQYQARQREKKKNT